MDKNVSIRHMVYLPALFNILLIMFNVTRLGNLLPKSPTFLGNYCKGVKMYHFSCEIIFGQLL